MRDVTVEVLIRRNTVLRILLENASHEAVFWKARYDELLPQRDAAVRDNQRWRASRYLKDRTSPMYYGGTLKDNVTQSRNARDAHDFF